MNRLTDSLDFQAHALTLRSERHRLIASNIANADTPGYVARDMDFAKALSAATGGMHAASGAAGALQGIGSLTASQPGHITSMPAGSSGLREGDLVYAMPSQSSVDRNTVDMDRERASFADNSVKYEATLRFINSSVRTTLSAITGQ